MNDINIILKKNKKKSIFLPVSAPFHCSLMQPAAKIMHDKIKQTNFKSPSISLVSNVTAEQVKDAEQIKDLLIKQIFQKLGREKVFYI